MAALSSTISTLPVLTSASLLSVTTQPTWPPRWRPRSTSLRHEQGVAHAMLAYEPAPVTRVRFNFPAQPADELLEARLASGRILDAKRCPNLGVRQHPSAISRQVQQQIEFRSGQVHVLLPDPNPVALLVDN